jgi:methylenetetrahydrofolate dehydrogenase (NADP+)/methenyltetrahydrofolate cyclohydrolase
MALLLLHRDATVTICHSRTPDLAATCRQADILVAAVGRPGFVTPDFVKPGATVIDVGINQVTDAAVVAGLYPPDHARTASFKARTFRGRRTRAWRTWRSLTPVPGAADDHGADEEHLAGRANRKAGYTGCQASPR